MYFKKLEIFGFKSFADKTVLNFEPGITAVVGPNGCGKSNVFDAIRWVLGEQSVKELRGSSMGDVIFNGTESKPSLGFAEVSVTFSNEQRTFPYDQDEVVITRRLFRSGESEYLINKTTSRLKDIQEMLMGTGIGAEAYSLVQQGRVDLVVSAKPEDRRIILDEASGITKYKAKKKEALSKLKETEDNLLRVNDIVVEVKRQISSIERQANKAKKYKEEFEVLKSLEIRMARHEVLNYARQRQEITDAMEGFKGKESSLSRELDDLNALLTNEMNYLNDLEQKINEINTQEVRIDGQIDINNRQIGFNSERIENINQSAVKLTVQKEQLIERCRQQQAKIEELKQIITVLDEKLKQNQAVLTERKEAVVVVERQIKEAKEKIVEDEEKTLALTSNQVGLRNQLTDIMREVQGALARKRRLEIEQEKVTNEKAASELKLQNVEFQIVSVVGTIDELKQQRDQRHAGIECVKADLAKLEASIDDLEKHRLFLTSQKEFIERLHTQYHDIPDPIIEGRIIVQNQPLEHHSGIIGKVKSVTNLDPEKLAQFKNVMNVGEVSQLFEVVCETKFIELDPLQISQKIDEITLQLDEKNVLRESCSAKLQEEMTLFRQLEQQISDRERVRSILDVQQRDSVEDRNKLLSELELLASELIEVQEHLESFKKKEEEFNFQLDTINQDIGWCQSDIKEKQDWINAKMNEKEQMTVALTQFEAESLAEREKLRHVQDSVQLASESLDSFLGEIKVIDDEIAGQAERKVQFEKDNDALYVKVEELRQQKDSFRHVLADYEVQKNDVAQRINSVRANTISLEEELETIKQQAHGLQLQEQQLGFNEKGVKDRLMQTYKINLEEILNPPVQEVTQQISEIPQEGEQTTENITPPTAVVPPVVFEEVTDVPALSQEIARLQKRCDAYGSVNLVAIEEYDQMKERFEFLTKQQSDLLEAKSQLMDTINKINRSTRQMFMDTFTKVSEEFRIYFRMLFGGGEAQLFLLDPENVLESGIEIVARPPGKKLQSISLLSGGEKTLTAIALIFGVFKVNPSPFCVLDEIDAALDESNVGRFSFLLKDFSKIAQFIVITHNKKTMSVADIMYGVTMPDTGVSKIVSVKFSEGQKQQPKEEPVAVEV